MNQEKVAEVKGKMMEALRLLMEALDLSITLIKENGREQIKTLWEDFLREFIFHTKNRSKETGVDLVSMVSISRIFR